MNETNAERPPGNEAPTIPGSQTALRRSYLLRLWCSNTVEPLRWQASLEDPQTGERVGFANLDHLFAYLIGQTPEITKHVKDQPIL